MTECGLALPYDFYAQRSLVVRFSALELSADAGILLARQAEETVQVCQRLADCIKEWRDPNKITPSLYQLVNQRVYQLVKAMKMPAIATALLQNLKPNRGA